MTTTPKSLKTWQAPTVTRLIVALDTGWGGATTVDGPGKNGSLICTTKTFYTGGGKTTKVVTCHPAP